MASPLPRGSGAITSLTRPMESSGFPPFSEGLNENENVEVELLTTSERNSKHRRDGGKP